MALMFNEAERGLIAGGRLTAFLRTWPDEQPRIPIGSTQLAYTRPRGTPFAKLRIRGANKTTSDALTQAQSKALGCSNPSVARAKVRDKWPGLVGEGRSPIWVVEFDVVEVL